MTNPTVIVSFDVKDLIDFCEETDQMLSEQQRKTDAWKTEAGWQRAENQKNFAARVEANRMIKELGEEIEKLKKRNESQFRTITFLQSQFTLQYGPREPRQYESPISVAPVFHNNMAVTGAFDRYKNIKPE